MKKNNTIKEKIEKLSKKEIDAILAEHFETVAAQEGNLEEAPELAAKLANLAFGGNLYPMNVWEILKEMLESMCKRGGINWYHGAYIKAIVPVMIEQIPEAYEVILNTVIALEKYQERFGYSEWQELQSKNETDILDSDIIQ